ncbi:MAG TPA: S8 family serine peptidase [Candidatus Paceibacterota bacterium]
MKKIHQNLLDTNPFYALWHDHPAHRVAHWVVFLGFSLLLSAISLSEINITYGQPNPFTTINYSGTEYHSIDLPKTVPIKTTQEPAEDRILVKFKSNIGSEKVREVLARNKLKEKEEISQIKVKIIELSPDDTPEEVIQRLRINERSHIEFAEVDQIVAHDLTPNDPYYPNEWHLPVISAPAAWDITQGDSNIIIAILDTGVNSAHPDLSSKIVPGWNTYDNNSNTSDVYGHGTKVAGTAAAAGNNAIGVAGIALNNSIMPVRISDLQGYGYSSTVAKGLTWAADHGARVANISYSFSGDSTVSTAAKYFQSKNGVVTMSAGNNSAVSTAPDDPYIMIVSATNPNDYIASWSNTGSNIDVSAPGVSIYTTTAGGGYSTVSGTSFSAPATAGVAGLILAANPQLSGTKVVSILKQNSDDLGPAGWDPTYGFGRINAYKSVQTAITNVAIVDTVPPSTPSNLIAQAPDNTKVNLSWRAATDDVEVVNYKVNRNGTVIATLSNTSYTDTGVLASVSYSYTVQALDAAGNISSPSNVVSVTVPATAPLSILNYSVSDKKNVSATIKWTTNIPSTGIIRYGTSSSDLNLSAGDSTVGTSHAITITNLKPSTKYYYRIMAQNIDDATSVNSPISNFRTSRK